MKLKHLIVLLLFVTASARADIIFLGDKSRFQLLKQCKNPCLSGKHEIKTPKLNAVASDVATLAKDASHAVIVVDASQGPLPIIREHVLIARQAAVPSLSIMFSNVSILEGMGDAQELLELEELEVREIFNMYEMGGDSAIVFFDNKIKVVPKLASHVIGLNAALRKLQNIPERKKLNIKLLTANQLSTYVYLLSPQEAKHTEPLNRDSLVKLWVDGQLQNGKIASAGISPGENGDLRIILDRPVTTSKGARFLLENNGQIIAVGVVANINN